MHRLEKSLAIKLHNVSICDKTLSDTISFLVYSFNKMLSPTTTTTTTTTTTIAAATAAADDDIYKRFSK